MTKNKKKVLLTGATGLIGKYAIAPLADAGFEVYAVSRKAGLDGRATWLEADLLDSASLAAVFQRIAPEYLLHLAWEVRHGVYLEENSNFSWVASGLEMLRLFHRHGGRRAVFAGTLSEYEFADRPLAESAPLAARSVYASCKIHMNALAALFCGRNGISFGWGRLFFPYGAHEQRGRLTPSVIDALAGGTTIAIKSGRLLRDYIYAKDAAAAFAAFLASSVEGAVNIATGRAVSIEEYCRTLGRLMGREELLVFEDRAGDQPPFIAGDNRRLLEEVRFVPAYNLETSFQDILFDMDICPR